MMKAVVFSISLVVLASPLFAQVTTIPDPNFEQALIDLEIDPNPTPDGQVMTADIDTIRELNVTNRNIADLTGIEDFSSLTSLNCSSNRIANLNISANSNLVTLICSSNRLLTLDVASNVNITTLLCSSNELSALDLSQNDTLKILDCSGNQLPALNVDLNIWLEHLNCSSNKLTALDISQNDSLTALSCSNNRLQTLDVSNNVNLESLLCASNQLTMLDVSSNLALNNLNFSYNLITSQDVSSNAALTTLNSSNNLLEYLDISNGNNDELTNFDATSNPLLSCIAVDDIAEIGEGWDKDITATYATNCPPVQTFIPDDNFEQALINLGLDMGPPDDMVITDSINSLTDLDISGENITNLTGIGDFSTLTSLNCSDNQIAALDLTKNTALTDLDCSDNNLADLNLKNSNNAILVNMDARNNPALTCITIDDGFTPGGGWQKDGGASYDVNCNGGTFIPDDNFEQALVDMGLDAGPLDNYVPTANINTITALDISGRNIVDLTGIEDFAGLDSLDCSTNLLSKLDVSNNASLTVLRCFSNYLPSLDVTSNTALMSLHCGDNLLSDLDISQNTELQELIFDSNFMTGIDISNNNKLVRLNCNSNKIVAAGFDLTTATNLERLLCSNNKLTDINISQNTSLIRLDCSANNFTALDLAANTALKKLDCGQNFLTNLDLSNNPDLDTLTCGSNKLTGINLDANPLLRMLVCDNNALSNIDVSNNNALRFLNVNSNKLNALDVSVNDELIHLSCDDNQLDELDVTNNANLTFLAFAENNLDAINITQNTALLSLNANGNELTFIDTEFNTALLELSVADNQLDTLGVGTNTALSRLKCDANELTILNLQNNTDLSELICPGNSIAHLDLSLQPRLTLLNCASNQLTSLSVKNGENDTLSTFNAIDNPGLLCIEVDDPMNTGNAWQKDDIAEYSANCRYNETYIPDDNFEAAVAIITGEPDNNDDYIATSAIDTLTALDVNNAGISDLTGIQDFEALQTLDVSNNSIDSIYLLNNGNLISLIVSANQLDTLDLSENDLLEKVDISSNAFTSFLSGALAALTSFNCDNNEITELDLSNNTALTELRCTANQLSILRMNNGNNASLDIFDATGNPDLLCIQIDDPANIGTSWLKDNMAVYSENCHYNETYVPDDAFEQALINLGYDYTSTGPLDDYIPTAKINQVPTLRIRDRNITDLTGIEDFAALTSLDCSNNQLPAMDISNNTNIALLNCSGNQLSQLNITSNTDLVNLNASGNALTDLNISQNTALSVLNCASNQLISLDIIPNTQLKEVYAQKNALFSVEASNGFNSSLLIFDLRNNPNLSCILVDDIAAAQGYAGWFKDEDAQYKLECNDDDNDGIPDVNDNCPATPFGNQVDLFGCPIFGLPYDNFTILTTSESCRTGNDGKINISAKEIHPYLATLTGSIDTVDYEFFDKVEIRNVRAGTYELCIRIIGQPDYEQCFNLQVAEPERIQVYQTSVPSNGRIGYALTGSSRYTVELNGNVFKTDAQYVELPLENGRNTIRIKTDIECQGVFEEIIHFADKISIFPNPFTNAIHVVTGSMEDEEIWVSIYAPSGKMMLAKKYLSINGKADINTGSLQSGMYVVEVESNGRFSSFKLVKP